MQCHCGLQPADSLIRRGFKLEQHSFYVCPACKKHVRRLAQGMCCDWCGQAFPNMGGAPDFTVGQGLVEDTQSSLIRRAYGRFFDLIAPIYESPAWYQLTLNLSGARGNSIRSIAEFLQTSLAGVTGTILDVACGPATYSRRIALPTREVYGIDLSVGMIRQGLRYLKKASLSNVHLARANVLHLPFEAAVFDGAICAGSIHLFPDLAVALREIKRTMKVGAPLAVQTFVPASSKGKPSIKQKTGFHEYQPQELIEQLSNAGFGELTACLNGTVLLARAKLITAA